MLNPPYHRKKMKVSVIIPVYNVAPYVECCLKSVMSQTYSGEIECLLVDDGSTDESISIIQRMLSDYTGLICFRLIHHDSNRGLSAARNTGIREATGDYIFFLDSDDDITADCLETLAGLACESPNAQMIVSDYRTNPETKRTGMKLEVGLPSEMRTNDDIANAYLRHWLSITSWNKLMTRSFILDNNLFFQEGIVYEDVLWTFYSIKYLQHIRINKIVTYHYRRRPGSIATSTKHVVLAQSFYAIYDNILAHLTQGRENQEVDSYAEGFCKHYLKYKATTPQFDHLLVDYQRKAKAFGCWSTLCKLHLAYLLGKVSFGLKLLIMLRKQR